MKNINLLIPVFILSVLLIFSITVSIIMKNISINLNEILAKSYDAAEINDFEKCKEYSDKFVKELKKSDPFLSFVVRHGEIDSIKWSAKRLNEYANEDSKSEFMAENAALKEMIEHLFENEKIVPHNII